jgi:hypothetical protein
MAPRLRNKPRKKEAAGCLLGLLFGLEAEGIAFL